MTKIKLLRYIRVKTVIPVLLIIIGWLMVYSHVVSYPLINWDDYFYILRNNALRGSLFDAVHNAFTELYHGNYYPLHILSYVVEFKLFGEAPFIYHLDNILLHLFNALLLFVLFRKLTGNLKVAFITSFLFAIHPVHVESVAWISERKDTLYLFFFLLAFLLQRYFVDKKKKRYLLWSYFFYLCSLLSKSTAVVFPVILFVTEYCFDKKFSFRKNLKTIIPYAFFAFIFSIVQVKGQDPPLYESKGIIKAVELFMRYIMNVIYPVNLSPRYEIHTDIPLFLIVAFVFVIVFFCIKKRLVLWAVLWQLCALLPVLNLIPNQIIMADRYLYLTAISMYTLFGFWIDFIIRKNSSFYKKTGLTLFLVVVTCLTLLTLHQTLAWKSTTSMWKRVMKVQPHDYTPVLELAMETYSRTYDIDESMKYLNMAKEKFPYEPDVYYCFGAICYDYGMHEEAKYYLNYALTIPEVHLNNTDVYIKLMHIFSLEGDLKNELRLFNDPDFQKYGKVMVELIRQKMSDRYQLVTVTHRMLLHNGSNKKIIYENILHLLNEGFLKLAIDLLKLSNKKYPDDKEFLFLKAYLNVLSNNIEGAKQIFNDEQYDDDFLKHKYVEVIVKPDRELLQKAIKMFPDEKMFLLEYAVLLIEQNGDDWLDAQNMMNDILDANNGWRFAPRFLYLKKLIMIAKRQRGYSCDCIWVHKAKPEPYDSIF